MPPHRVAIVYPALEVMRQAVQQTNNKKKKQNKLTDKLESKTKQREPTKLNKQVRHPHDRATFRKNRNERKECPQKQISRGKKTTFKAAAAVCGACSLGKCPPVGLVPCYLSVISFLLSSTAFSLRLLRTLRVPLVTTHSGCVAIPAQCHLNPMPLRHEAFRCFENPEIPLAGLLSCNCSHFSLHPKNQLGVFRRCLGGIEVVK